MLKTSYKNQNDGSYEQSKRIKGNDFPNAGGGINLNVIEGKAYYAVGEKEGEEAAENTDENAACNCAVNSYIKGIAAYKKEGCSD